jgi:hypothetical protein
MELACEGRELTNQAPKTQGCQYFLGKQCYQMLEQNLEPIIADAEPP